jgi:TRAP-type C4-dicarboxylate transport system permease small subunit
MLRIDKLIEIISVAILALSSIVGFVTVVLRYVFETSISWAFEVSTLSLVYLTFLTSYLALRGRVHLKVDILVKKLPRSMQTAIFFAVYLCMGLVAVVMVYYGAIYSFSFPGKTTEILEMPVVYIYLIIPISGLLMALDIAYSICRGVSRVLVGGMPEEPNA